MHRVKSSIKYELRELGNLSPKGSPEKKKKRKKKRGECIPPREDSHERKKGKTKVWDSAEIGIGVSNHLKGLLRLQSEYGKKKPMTDPSVKPVPSYVVIDKGREFLGIMDNVGKMKSPIGRPKEWDSKMEEFMLSQKRK